MHGIRTALLLGMVTVLSGCGGSGGTAADSPPSLTVSEPQVERDVAAGVPVDIAFQAFDDDSEALVDVFADADGDPSTTGDQYALFSGIPERDGALELRTWITNNVPAGSYRILLRIDDGSNPPVVTAAPGMVVVRANPAPAATIEFPPSYSVLEAGAVVVRGRASDENGIASLTVNGVVPLTDDGFATWELEFALSPGQNVITVATEDALGQRDEFAARAVAAYHGPVIHRVVDVDFDQAANRAYVLLPGNRVASVDMATGARNDVAGSHRGTGDDIDEWAGLALDTPRNRLLVWNHHGEVLAVDLATRHRTVVFDNGTVNEHIGAWDPDGQRLVLAERNLVSVIDVATGQVLRRSIPARTGFRNEQVSGAAWDPVRGLVFLSQWYRNIADSTIEDSRIIALDPGDGTWDELDGGGPGLPDFLWNIRRDASSDRLYVIDFNGNVTAVDPDTGDRERFLDVSATPGPQPEDPFRLVVDTARDRAFWFDERARPLVAADLAAGTLSIPWPNDRAGSGVPFAPAYDVLETGDGAVFLATSDGVLRIAPETGERTLFALDGQRVGSLAGDAAALYVGDWSDDAIYVIRNGALEEVSGPSRGAGPVLGDARSLLLEENGSRLAVLTRDGLYHVDVATGDRAAVSDAATGTGPALNDPQSVIADPLGAGYVVTLTRSVVAVDASTGDRTEVSGRNRGSGTGFSILQYGAADSADTLILLEPFLDKIISVDRATGDRTQVLQVVGWILDFGNSGGFGARLDAERRVLHVAQVQGQGGPPALHTIDLVTGLHARRAD